MNRTILLVIAVIGMLLVGGATAYLVNPAPKAVRLQLSGPTGAKVTGSYEADGLTHSIDGTLPLTVEATANTFNYAVTKNLEEGDLKGELFVDGHSVGHSIAQGPKTGVRGHYRKAAFSESLGFTTISEDESLQE